MKKIFYIIISTLLMATSCSYLDLTPEQGLNEADVFSTYANFKAYFEAVYDGDPFESGTGGNQYPYNLKYGSFPLVMESTAYRMTIMGMTELEDQGRKLRSHTIKAGSLGENVNIFVSGRIPIFSSMYRVIRVVNKCIENIDMLQDATQEEKDDLLGQAYFVRGWAHMTLCNFFGGVPYIDHALGAEENSDLPQIPASEVYQKVAEDMDKAYRYFDMAGVVRRDNGNLSDKYQNRPNGVAAKAVKGRALLYAASALNNRSNNEQLWIDAAKANSEALDIALANSYDLVDFTEWSTNWVGKKYTNEQLWAWNLVTSSSTKGTYVQNHMCRPITQTSGAAGASPTQQAVDMFETASGYPLYTAEEREIAIKAKQYNEQNPYVNRDPRFYETIIFDGCVSRAGKKVNMYYDNDEGKWAESDIGKKVTFCVDWNSDINNGYTNTGYYSNRMWDGASAGSMFPVTDPLIRLAEVYLNYAEAANEAYGPNGGTSGQISALEAVNIVRNRAGMPGVRSEFTGSKELLRDRIRNERTVEFMFEGTHYYIDSRRWMVAPKRMSEVIYGIHVEKVPVSSEYPIGRKFTRKPIPEDRQATWKDAMYYFFLPSEEANKLGNYVNNESW